MDNSDFVRVTVAVPHALDTAPSQRFRWEQWAPILRRHRIDIEFIPFCTPQIERLRKAGDSVAAARHIAARFPGWLAQMTSARRSDVLVVQRNAALAGPPIVEVLLAKSGVPLVYDFDDAVHLKEDETKESPLRKLMRSRERVSILAQRASLVMAGNETLADYARQYSRNVEVWPTTVSTQSYALRAQNPAGTVPVIGWSGSTSTAKYIKELLPVLRRLAERMEFRLLIVGADFDLEGLAGECRPWTPETEVANLQEMDVGLMPLPDNKWTRGKCALKAIQYLAVGVPAVVSDVGMNSEAVPEGRCGFVVRDDDGWIQRIGQLIESSSLRQELGTNGRKHVEQYYSAETLAPTLARTLRRLADRA